MFLYIAWVAAKYFRDGQRRRAIALLAGVAFFFIGAFNDTAVSLGWYPFIYLMEYYFMGLILCGSSVGERGLSLLARKSAPDV